MLPYSQAYAVSGTRSPIQRLSRFACEAGTVSTPVPAPVPAPTPAPTPCRLYRIVARPDIPFHHQLASDNINRCVALLYSFWQIVGAPAPMLDEIPVLVAERSTLFDIAMEVVGRTMEPPLMPYEEYREHFFELMQQIMPH